jgi:uncharacterized protein (DUF427 family)
MKAIYNDTVIAESDDTVIVEGNHYFPPSALEDAFFEESTHTSTCPWKGKASYYNVVVEDQRNDNAAWVYHDPKDAAAEIKDHVAFWKDVEVVD